MKNDVEILCDISSNGKKRDWKNKKSRSLFMADHHAEIDGLQKKAARMYDCGNVLKFKAADGQLKLYQAYFCKARLCPMCNWRRSLKIAYQNKRIVQALNEREKVQWVFLTLTVKNVEAADLKNEMDKMTKSFNALTRYVRFAKSVKGYFRALEVTKNNDRTSKSFGTYHPHFHVLLAVPSNYYGVNYIKQSDWATMWQKALKIDYKPIVYVQKVKPRETSLEPSDVETDISYQLAEQNAILEVSKYPVKDADILQDNTLSAANVETVKDLDTALAYKRLISYGGVLKELHKELNLEDAEDGDLIHIDENNDDEIANGALEVMAYWHVGLNNYVIKKNDD